MKTLNPILIVLLLVNCSKGQNKLIQDKLSRRPFIGVRADSLEKDKRESLGISNGVNILAVLPNSTGESAGIQSGDIIMSINKTPVSSPQSLVSLVLEHKVGEKLEFIVMRGRKTIKLHAVLASFPKETYNDLTVEYGQVTVDSYLLRTITTSPKSKKGSLPGILYIQGIGCGSIDYALDTTSSQAQLINSLARSGNVVMRVEKAGNGDSQGLPCSELDFNTEASGYHAGLKALSEKPEVNKNELYIIGHSMGGVWAPSVAEGLHVKGIAVYGTIVTNYIEYIINSRRTVAKALGLTPAQADDYVKTFSKCFGLYYAVNMDMERSIRICPDCQNPLQLTTIRSKEFMSQLYELNIPDQWNKYRGKVLSMWGNADYISVRQDHQILADIINESHPGNATFVEIPDADHGMNTAYGFTNMGRNRAPFNFAISETINDWIHSRPIKIGKKVAMENFKFPYDSSLNEVLNVTGVENAYPRWAANNHIVFQSNRDSHWQIYSMNQDGTNQRNLSNNSGNDFYVSTSKDGRSIAFVSDRDGNEEIYTMNLEGGNVRRLTNDPGRDIHPYFSPDGKKLLFNSNRDTKSNLEVYEMNLNGTGVKRLTFTPDENTCARLSPDQGKIVYLSGLVATVNDEILVMDSRGKNPTNVTKSQSAEGWPLWSPDGKKIYYASDNTGTFCIYEMNTDGSEKRQLTNVTAPFLDARPEISNDGTKLLFNRQVTERNGKNTIAIYIKNIH